MYPVRSLTRLWTYDKYKIKIVFFKDLESLAVLVRPIYPKRSLVEEVSALPSLNDSYYQKCVWRAGN